MGADCSSITEPISPGCLFLLAPSQKILRFTWFGYWVLEIGDGGDTPQRADRASAIWEAVPFISSYGESENFSFHIDPKAQAHICGQTQDEQVQFPFGLLHLTKNRKPLSGTR